MNRVYAINDPLAVIYNEDYWRINRVSPMYNVQFDEIKLKQYALKIRQALVSNIVKTSSIKYKVIIEDLPNLKYSDDDPDSLMVTVSSSQENDKTDKVVYTAILMSWGVYLSSEVFTHLPYMLERGEVKVGVPVKAAIQNMFDCIIKQYNFTQQYILQFGFNFVDSDTSRGSDPFVLVYKSVQANFKDKLTLTFEIADVHTAWNKVKEETGSESELVHLTYQVLQNQVYEASETLDISVFDLCEVILTKAVVKNSGIIKMKTPEIVNSVFTVLNKISNDLLTFEIQIAEIV